MFASASAAVFPYFYLVYVPFAGSGSELEACERLGRRWVASDTDPQCVRMAQERIDEP